MSITLTKNTKIRLWDLLQTVEDISEDFTFGDMLRLMVNIDGLEDWQTVQLLRCPNLSDYIEECFLENPPEGSLESEYDTDFIKAEFSIVCYSERIDSGKKGQDATLELEVFGMAENTEGELESFSVEFTPLYELRDVPFRLSSDHTFLDVSKREDRVTRPSWMPRVLDLFESVAFEISMHGSPTARNQNLKDLQETLKRYKEEEE